MYRLAHKHLDTELCISKQDKRRLRRCVAEVGIPILHPQVSSGSQAASIQISACWPYEGCYDDDWPIRMCLQRYLLYRAGHSPKSTSGNPQVVRSLRPSHPSCAQFLTS